MAEVISDQQEMLNQFRAQQATIDVDLMDGMAASAADTWRAGPTAAIGRAFSSVFDTSESIKAGEANQMFGLDGTTAAVPDGEEITVEAARKRAEDFHELRMNEIIQETVNDESPIMGRVTQFAASMATSLVDPALMGTNVVGGIAVRGGINAITKGGRLFNGIAKASPSAAKMMVSAYSETMNRSLMTVVAREGLENFAGSVLEVGAIKTMGFGDDQLSRKISNMEHLQTIAAGTLMGGFLGTVISRDGRKAIARKFGRDYGDDAAEYLQAQHIISAEEARSGIEKSNIEAKLYNRETFGSRPWYKETFAPFEPSDTSIPSKLYLSVDKDGNVHTFSHRGAGTTMTASLAHAYNKGAKVIELDTTQLRLLQDSDLVQNGKRTQLGNKIAYELGDELAETTDFRKLTEAIAILKDPDVDLSQVRTMNKKALRSEVRQMLEGKNLEEVMDVLDELGIRTQSAYNPLERLHATLGKEGFDGYSFAGKDAFGKPAYKGVHVIEASASKLKKTAEYETPVPGEGDLLKWRMEEEQILKEHANWVKTKARSLNEDLTKTSGVADETPNPEVNHKSHYQEAVASTQEKQAVLDVIEKELEEEIGLTEVDGKLADPDKKATLDLIKKIKSGADPEKILAEESDRHAAYLNCIIGAMT